MRTYNNLDELDRDLKVLKLQQQVHKETMKLNINEVKENLTPLTIATNIISSIAKKAIIFKVVDKLIGAKK